MRLNKKSGFTLLEIIIVVIIVGVLASLALPRLFSTVEYSRSSEAMAAFSSIRGALDRCALLLGNYTNCNDIANDLDIPDPAASPGAHFTYAITNATQTAYTIVATRNSTDGGTAGDTITLTNNGTTVTRSGTGAFDNVQ